MELQCGRTPAFDQTIAGVMSGELHKTAQPLTILQGLLELMLARVSTGDECGKSRERVSKGTPGLIGCDECRCFLSRVSQELPRLASCFDNVRKLAGIRRPAGDIATFPVSSLVTDVLQNLRGHLDIAGITAVFDMPPSEDPMSAVVNASPTRVFTAVRSVLAAFIDCLQAGDRIKIAVETDGSNVAIRVRSSRHFLLAAKRDLLLSTLSSQVEFAKLLFASMGGELRLNKTPDTLVMVLPAAASQSAADNSHKELTHV